jgi:hypothetical protein
LERQKQQEQQAETHRAVVKDLAKVLGEDFEPDADTVKAVRKALADSKANQARLAAVNERANTPGRKAFAHITGGPAMRF